MGNADNSVAGALARAHAAILKDLRELEGAADPASAQGVAGLRSRLAATRAHLAEHFRFEEDNGYMDTLREREPRLERTIRRLAEEHRRLARSLDAIIQQAGSASRLDDALGEQVRDWIGRLRRHEAGENELVQDAFNVDIGAED